MSKTKRRTLTNPMLNRIIEIHRIIKSGAMPTNEQLAEKLEVGTSTISLDIRYLREYCDAPIKHDAFLNGYYYTEPFELSYNNLTTQDMEVLVSAKTLLSHFEGTPLYDNLFALINFLVPNDSNNTTMLNRIAVPPVAKSFYDKNIWQQIYDAMKQNYIIEFDYNGLWRDEPTHRKVHPYQLVMDDGQVYLYGYSEEREAERLFCLTRMSNMVITKKQFKLPENYDFGKKCNGGKFGFYYQDNKTKFRIRFLNVTRKVIKERLWADDQVIEEHEDYVDLTFTSNQQGKILDWVLSLGSAAVPLEPEWFVDLWKQAVKETAENAGLL